MRLVNKYYFQAAFDLCKSHNVFLKRFIGIGFLPKILLGEIMKQEYKKYYEQFGLNVVYYRKKKRLTQMKLAELVEIDRSHISAIELGNVGVSFDVVFKLCEVLEIMPKQLFDFREWSKIKSRYSFLFILHPKM